MGGSRVTVKRVKVKLNKTVVRPATLFGLEATEQRQRIRYAARWCERRRCRGQGKMEEEDLQLRQTATSVGKHANLMPFLRNCLFSILFFKSLCG